MAINIRFTAQEQEVIKALKAMGGETAKLVQKNIELANQFARTDAEAKFFARGIERARKENAFFKKELSDTASTLLGLQSGFFGGVGGSIGAVSKLGGLQGAAIGAGIDGVIALGQEVSKTTEKYNRLQMALDTATGSAVNGAKAFSFIVDIARQTGLRIDDLADSYKGFAAASRGTKLEGKETERIFTSIVKAGAAMMLSNEQVKGSLLAVSQMMSKGNVQAEELRGQLSERLPGAFNILASEMKVTTAQLNDMLKAGAVLSEVALPLLANGLDKISKDQYKKNLDTITGAMNNLRNEVDLVMVSFGRQSNINGFFASLINGFASVVRSGGFNSFVEGMMNAVPVLGVAYTGYKAAGAIKESNEPYRKITKEEAIIGASSTSLSEQKRWLDEKYKRLKELRELSDPNKNRAANSQQLNDAKKELEVLTQNYSLKKKFYEGERIQRAAAAEELKKKVSVNKEESKGLKEISKEVRALSDEYNKLKKADPNFVKSDKAVSIISKIEALNKEKSEIQRIAKLGKPSTGNAESEFEKQIRKENEAGKDLFKERLEIIKQARLDAERLANTPTAFSSSPIDSVMPLFGGKKVADIQTGFGNDLLQSSILKEKYQKSLDKIISELKIDTSKIKVEAIGMDVYRPILDTLREGSTEFENLASGAIVGALQNTVTNGFSAIKTAIDNGENPFKAFGETAIGYLGDMMIQMGTTILSSAVPVMLGLAAATGGLTTAQAIQLAAAGTGMMVTGGLLKAVKFAEGGIVSGRTFAEVGEYSGARNNPEVIAPLNKLSSIFTPFFQRAVSMGRVNQPKLATQPITTTTNVYMDGKVLLQQLDRTILRQGRI